MTTFLIVLAVVLALTLLYVSLGFITYRKNTFNVWSKDIRYTVTALFAWAFLILGVGLPVTYYIGETYDDLWKWVSLIITVALALLIVALNVRKLYRLNIQCNNKFIAIIFTVLQSIVSPIVLVTFLIVFLIRMGNNLRKAKVLPQSPKEPVENSKGKSDEAEIVEIQK